MPAFETRSGLDVGLHAAEPLEEIPIDLSQTNVASYAGLDQPDGTTVFDATGASVRVTGTRWIETLSAHDIVPSSLLSFDFRSSNSGVPSAIGFDDDGDPTTGIRLLDLGGGGGPHTRTVPQTYQGSWQTYRVPIGRFFTGDALHLVLGVSTPSPGPSVPPPAETEIREVRLPEPALATGLGLAVATLAALVRVRPGPVARKESRPWNS